MPSLVNRFQWGGPPGPQPTPPSASVLTHRRGRRPHMAVLLAFASLAPAAPTLSFHVMGDAPGSWPAILSSVGLRENANASLLVIPSGAQISFQECQSRLDRGAILILEGASPLAESFGFRATSKPHVIVRSVEDVRAPKLHIVWEKPLEMPVFEIPRRLACSRRSAGKECR